MDPAALAAGPAAARGDLRSAGWRHAEVSGRVGGNSGPNPLPPKASAGQRQQLRRRQSVGLGRPAGAPALLGSNAIAGLGAARLLSPSPHPQLPARQRKPTRCSSEVSAEAAPGSAPSPTDTSAHDTSLQATPPLDTSPLDTSAPSLLPLGPIATSSGRETARLMAEAQDWEAALRLLRGLQQQQGPGAAEAIHFNILLNLAGQAQQWELLERTYDEMMSTPEGAGARPDNYTFSTLISSSIRGERHDLAIQWIERMAATPGCVPDQVTYSTIIHALGRSSQPGEALRVYRRMADSGWAIDSTTYGTVISLFVNARQYKGAHNFYVKLRNSGERLEEGVYNSILTAYRDQGLSTNALQVLGDMRAAGVGPSSRTHCLIMEALGKAGQQGEMLQYFRRAKVMDGRADAVLYSIAIGVCRKWGDLKQAKELYREMRSDGVAPNEAVLRHMLSVCAEQADEAGCAKVRNDLEAMGVPMDIKAYSNVVHGLGVAGRWGGVKEVVAEMRAKGMEADAYLTCIFLSLLARAVATHGPPGTAPRGTNGVPEGDLEEDSSASSSVFEGLLWCLEQLNAGGAWEIVTAVAGASASGEVESGVQGLVEPFLASLDPKPRQVACNSLLDLLWAWGRVEDALAVWHTAERAGMYEGVVPRSAVAAARPPKGGRYSRDAGANKRLTVTYPLGQLDVRQLSVGSAHVALFLWLSRLQAAAEKGQRIPETLEVKVGLGSFRRQGGGKAGGTVRDGVVATLQRIGVGFAPGGRGAGGKEKASLVASRDETLALLINSDWRSLFVEPGMGTSAPQNSSVPFQETATGGTVAVTDLQEATVTEGPSSEVSDDSLAGSSQSLPAVQLPQEASPAEDRDPGSSRTPSAEAEASVTEEVKVHDTGAGVPSAAAGRTDTVDLHTADGQYWELEGFIGWQSSSGWMRRCTCGEYVESRRRKCGGCGASMPNKEAFRSGTCVAAAVVPVGPT